jgi:hypothetical protein
MRELEVESIISSIKEYCNSSDGDGDEDLDGSVKTNETHDGTVSVDSS